MAKKQKKTTRTPQPEQATEPAPRIWDKSWFPAAVFMLLSLVYFSEFIFSNKVVFGYDVGMDFHQGAEMSIGEKLETLSQPMWNPQMGGFPQSEEIRPQYFPTYFIYFFTTYQRYLGWRYILTMFFAGWGMCKYLREVQVRRWAALWAGVAYMSAPTFLAFTYAGHYAKMGVIALLPWMCFFLERGMSQRRLIYFVGLGVAIALGIYSPHPQMLYHALCGIGLYFLFRLYQFYRKEEIWRRLLGRAGLFALAVVLGLALGAEGAFPVFLYTRTESKRAAGGDSGAKSAAEQLAFARSWSLHPEEVGSLVVPEFGGFTNPKERTDYYWGRNFRKDNSEYFGILALLLALVIVPEARRQPLVLFMSVLFVLVLAYTLGGHAPVHWLAFHLLPGVKVMRTIGMSAFLFAFAACVLAALGLSRALAEGEEAERAALGRRLLIVGGILTGISLLVAAAPRVVTDVWISTLYSDITASKRQILAAGYGWLARGGLYVALVSGCGAALLYLRLRQKISPVPVVAGLCVLTLFDTWRIDRIFLRYEDPARYMDIRKENPRTVQFLRSDGDLFRIFPLPSFKKLEEPGHHLGGIPMVTGFNNLTIGRYDRILQAFSRVKDVHPLLNLLNAKYIVAPVDIELRSDRFPRVFTGERFHVYENPSVLPWFYLAPSFQVEDEQQTLSLLKNGQVDPRKTAILERGPPAEFSTAAAGDTAQDRIERLDYDPPAGYIRLRTHSSGPRVLVVSENYHSNWRVFVDGEQAEMYRANYVWKAACLPAGEHVVEFRYRSPTLVISRAASFLSLLVVLGIGGWELYRRRRQRPAGEIAEEASSA